MPNIALYNEGRGFEPSATVRAARAWRRISDKPASVQFNRAGVGVMAAQTVRIEIGSGYSRGKTTAGVDLATDSATIYGIQGHATLPDTDMQEGDRFVYGNREYIITGTVNTIGELQAFGQVTE